MRKSRAFMALAAIAAVATACTGTTTPSASTPAGSAPAASEAPQSQAAAVYSDGDTITIVVPFNAGGGYDVTTRFLAPCVETALEASTGADLTVVVQNVAGASGQVGTTQVAGAAPDGKTLLMNAVDVMVPQQVVQDAEFDVSEFTPLARFAVNGRMLIIRKDLLPEDADFMDLVDRSATTPVLIGGGGIGNQIQMVKLLLEDAGTPFQMDAVEFEGTGEGVAAMLRGELEAYLVGTDGAVDAVEANPDDIRVLTALSDQDPLLGLVEGVPTLTQSNVPNGEQIGLVSGTNTRAFFAPPGLSPELTTVLSDALEAAMKDDTCVKQITDSGAVVTYGDAETLRTAIEETIKPYEQFKDRLTTN